jgi:hypothetical protein
MQSFTNVPFRTVMRFGLNKPSRSSGTSHLKKFAITATHRLPNGSRRRTTNLCHNAVDRHLKDRADQAALIFVSTETDQEDTYTYTQLHAEVQRMAAIRYSHWASTKAIAC